MHAGEWGITLQLALAYDLAGHTARVLRIQRPDGSTVDREPTVASEATGALEYVTVEGDFPDPGGYVLQPIVTFPTLQLVGDEVLLPVDPVLPAPPETS